MLGSDLRLSTDAFSQSLLAAEGQQVGKYDSRFVLPLAANGNDPVADDPAMGQYVPGFVAALNLHMRNELGVAIDDTYLPIEFQKVNFQWDYGSGPGVFTRGDYAGDLLYATLGKFGFARGSYGRDGHDSFELVDCRVTNAVRCVPPENKPTPEEARTCRTHFLVREIAAMPRLRAILALGQIAQNMRDLGIPEIAVKPRNPDFQTLAQAYGIRSVRPDSLNGIEAALREAFQANGPTLIEVREDSAFLA